MKEKLNLLRSILSQETVSNLDIISFLKTLSKEETITLKLKYPSLWNLILLALEFKDVHTVKEKINLQGKRKVFDFRVKNGRLFSLNNFKSHNCDMAIDEIDYFSSDKTGQVTRDAVRIIDALEAGLKTINKQWSTLYKKKGIWNLPLALSLKISSVNVMDGILLKSIRANKDNPRVITGHKATFEVHPEFEEKDFEDDLNDPTKRESILRNFYSIPSIGSNTFFTREEQLALEKLCKRWPKRTPLVDYEVKDKLITKIGSVRRYIKLTEINHSEEVPHLLFTDFGLKRNSTTFILATTNVTGLITIKQIIELEPDFKEGIFIDHTLVFNEFVYPLLQNMNIRVITYDQWQDVYQRQMIENDEELETEAIQFSPSYLNFENFKHSLLNGNIRGYRASADPSRLRDSGLSIEERIGNDAMLHFLWQCMAVGVAGFKLVKPQSGTRNDDIFRALVGGFSFIQDIINSEDEEVANLIYNYAMLGADETPPWEEERENRELSVYSTGASSFQPAPVISGVKTSDDLYVVTNRFKG